MTGRGSITEASVQRVEVVTAAAGAAAHDAALLLSPCIGSGVISGCWPDTLDRKDSDGWSAASPSTAEGQQHATTRANRRRKRRRRRR